MTSLFPKDVLFQFSLHSCSSDGLCKVNHFQSLNIKHDSTFYLLVHKVSSDLKYALTGRSSFNYDPIMHTVLKHSKAPYRMAMFRIAIQYTTEHTEKDTASHNAMCSNFNLKSGEPETTTAINFVFNMSFLTHLIGLIGTN